MSSAARPARRSATLAALVGLVAGLVATVTATAPARADNVATPGNFTGYGFDQCLAPTQQAMTAWLNHSPFLSVGIYISGDSRACRSQPNLTRDWVSTQLRTGWRLLPITLGPQASCSTRFPRYGDDEVINWRPGSTGKYTTAREQGRAEAVKAVAAATRLGIVPRSTLWYDLEGFDHTRTHCRESALAFLSAWTTKLHALDYVSGVYSSVGSGIKILDDARVERPRAFNLPDRIWLARWDGVANTSSSYIRSDGWRPGGRVKQYHGRAQRDLGRRDDQHRPQLPRPREGVLGPAGDPLRRRRREPSRTTPGSCPAPRPPSGSGRCSACSGRPGCTTAGSTASTGAPRWPASMPGRSGWATPYATAGPGRTG